MKKRLFLLATLVAAFTLPAEAAMYEYSLGTGYGHLNVYRYAGLATNYGSFTWDVRGGSARLDDQTGLFELRFELHDAQGTPLYREEDSEGNWSFKRVGYIGMDAVLELKAQLSPSPLHSRFDPTNGGAAFYTIFDGRIFADGLKEELPLWRHAGGVNVPGMGPTAIYFLNLPGTLQLNLGWGGDDYILEYIGSSQMELTAVTPEPASSLLLAVAGLAYLGGRAHRSPID